MRAVNTAALYSESLGFKSVPGDWLSSLKDFVVFFSPFRQIMVDIVPKIRSRTLPFVYYKDQFVNAV
jgi:hypothetical protein